MFCSSLIPHDPKTDRGRRTCHWQFGVIFGSERLETAAFAQRDETVTVYGASLALLDTIQIQPPENEFEVRPKDRAGSLIAEKLHQIDLIVDAANEGKRFVVELEGRLRFPRVASREPRICAVWQHCKTRDVP